MYVLMTMSDWSLWGAAITQGQIIERTGRTLTRYTREDLLHGKGMQHQEQEGAKQHYRGLEHLGTALGSSLSCTEYACPWARDPPT